MAKNKKIIRYRKPLTINIGMIIFSVIFFYLSFSVYSYLRRDKIQFYEVAEGSIVNDTDYNGLIFRSEKVHQTESTGYVNYFVREGKRAAMGASVYSLDETGELGKFLSENQGEGTEMSKENYAALKQQLSAFVLSYRDTEFSDVYQAQYSLQNAVSEYMDLNTLDTLSQALEENGIHYTQVTTDEAGIVSYIIDGYEGIDPTQVTEDSFDRSKYTRSSIHSGDLTESGTPVYKLIDAEDWSVVFPLDQHSEEMFADRKRLQIKPEASDLVLTGRYSVFDGADGKRYGRLDFDKYMIQFVSERFMKFEILTNEASGLKIPLTAVTNQDFYTIPNGYLTTGGDQNAAQQGVMKEVYDQNGQSSVEFIPVEVARRTDENFYIEKKDGGDISDGDYLVMPDSQERYQIGATETRQGCYNINKGYAVFRVIEPITDNGEYMIIEKNTTYGLSVYDHIVLNAKEVTEGQMIYQ